MIIALAGRRVDAADAASPRFPLRNVPLVEGRLEELFEREAARGLVSSAACGADLVAAAAAARRGLHCRVVLPFDRERFRVTSVTDRPGDWGSLYDRLLAQLDPGGDVVTLDGRGEEGDAYRAANDAILDEAAGLARTSSDQVLAVLVWEGAPRDGDDMTAAFGAEARRRGWPVAEVRTL